MDPWDFGTGFMSPATFGGVQPVAPDLTNPLETWAAGLAAQGIRPGQFLQNPGVAAPIIAPQAPAGNNWDPTPVDQPGGPPVTLPNQPLPTSSQTTTQAPEAAAADASAAASPTDKQGDLAKRLTDSLRGVRMPVVPPAQTVRTPQPVNPTAPRDVKAGQLMALLQMINAGGQGVGKLPSLGGAIR